MAEKGKIVRSRATIKVKKIMSRIYPTRGHSLPPTLVETQVEKRRLSSKYPKKVYPGKISLFAPSEGPDGYYHDSHMGWEGWAAGGVEIHEIPGKFASIVVEPSVQILAQRMKDCLDRAIDDHQEAKF